jgi:hypothetical protein
MSLARGHLYKTFFSIHKTYFGMSYENSKKQILSDFFLYFLTKYSRMLLI